MVAIPAPSHDREEWNDADFDLPEDAVISPPSNNDSDGEDWDVEMDFGKTGGARAMTISQGTRGLGSSPLSKGRSGMVTIRPTLGVMSESTSPEDGDDDEGISTIKISALPSTSTMPKSNEDAGEGDDDLEADFAIPSDLTQLSLVPRELHHRGSKASLEWGDRDHTSSSTTSSDAYSTLGFNPSCSSTSASQPASEDECNDDDDNDLDGLVIPSGLFETDQGRKHLVTILDLKKKTPKIDERSTVASPNAEDDFEIGLVINGDDDLSPSKFAQTQETKRGGPSSARSNSMPARTSTLRPPSRLKGDRPRTPVGQSGVSSRTATRISSSPPLRPSTSRRANTFQALPTQPIQAPSSFVAPKQTVIRGQKSHGVLKAHSPTHSRRLRV